MILRTNPDGTYLGADENGTIYDGTLRRVGYDEMDVQTDVADDGLSYTRTNFINGEVYSKGTVTKDGFVATLPADPPLDQSTIDAAWAKECAISSHQKVMVEAVDANGDFTTVERTFKTIDWKAR